MAILIINSTAEERAKICKAVRHLKAHMPTIPISAKDICNDADIKPNRGRFVIDDCVVSGLITKDLLIDKGPKFKRFTYSITELGLQVIKEYLQSETV